MDFVVVSVFVISDPLRTGNPLAVFTEPNDLTGSQMQAIARSLNLSETVFVVAAETERYEVRIFTPTEEMRFAGHPTVGTAWWLREKGMVGKNDLTQTSPDGRTRVWPEEDLVWFERRGNVEADLESTETGAPFAIGKALGLSEQDLGLEARELGRSGRFRPAYSNAGLRQLMVPVRDESALQRIHPRPDLLAEFGQDGVYCFTAAGAGKVKARGLFPAIGVAEDPATGSAAAALGLYLADRIGPIRFDIAQGAEIDRPSRILVDAAESVRVGGACGLISTGRLENLPTLV